MKTLFKILPILLFITACSKDNDTQVDPRAAFVGEYETEDYDLAVFFDISTPFDTIIAVNGGTDIQIHLNDNDPDEIVFEGFEEFIEKGMLETGIIQGPDYSITSDEAARGTVESKKFELKDTEFTLATPSGFYPITLTGEGGLEENVLLLEFEYSITEVGQNNGDALILSGEVEMEKQN